MRLLSLAFARAGAVDDGPSTAHEARVGSENHIRDTGVRLDIGQCRQSRQEISQMEPLPHGNLVVDTVNVALHPGIDDVVDGKLAGSTHQDGLLPRHCSLSLVYERCDKADRDAHIPWIVVQGATAKNAKLWATRSPAPTPSRATLSDDGRQPRSALIDLRLSRVAPSDRAGRCKFTAQLVGEFDDKKPDILKRMRLVNSAPNA